MKGGTQLSTASTQSQTMGIFNPGSPFTH